MKNFSIAIILLLFCLANAEYNCRVIGKNCVLCRSEYVPKRMSVYHLKKDGSWIMKLFTISDDEVQAVHVRTYKDYNMNWCFFSELRIQDSVVTESDIKATQERCSIVKDSMFSEIMVGNEIEFEKFDEGFGSNYEEPFSMYCVFSVYVETHKYNKKGKLIRKKNYTLEPGDYCTKFLSNSEIYWKP